MERSKSLKTALENMNKVLQERLKQNTELKDENQNIRNTFQKMVGILKRLPR